jgi:glyoxylase-like metal-dependent hydrolase (beta-lactamase superfamily II)
MIRPRPAGLPGLGSSDPVIPDFRDGIYPGPVDRGVMERFGTPGPICSNCGVAFPSGAATPRSCAICDDERVTRPKNQEWTTMPQLAATHACDIRQCEPGRLASIGVTPAFAIGQRAMLVEQSDGCVLWDCVSLVERKAIEYINARGGLKAIALSHPHFYGSMAEWSKAFGDVAVYVHEADRQWVVHAPAAIAFWSGDTREVAPGVTLVRAGGHFDGGTVMHVAQAASGRGALLTGDVIMVTQYGSGVSFMRSYPTYVPLYASQVRHLRFVLAPFRYEALYGAWWDRVIECDGASIVDRTAQRYLELLSASK